MPVLVTVKVSNQNLLKENSLENMPALLMLLYFKKVSAPVVQKKQNDSSWNNCEMVVVENSTVIQLLHDCFNFLKQKLGPEWKHEDFAKLYIDTMS